MVQGFKDLLSSEHGLFGILIMICATVLVALGRLTVDQWVGFAEWIFTAYAGAHGLVAVAGAIESKNSQPTVTVQTSPQPSMVTNIVTGDSK